MTTYIIHGNPVSQGRPRATRIGAKKVTLFDPEKSRTYKQYVRNYLKGEVKEYFENTPLSMTVSVYIPIPKSYSKKKRKEIEQSGWVADKKPDLSNYIKLIEDAANEVLYDDDSRIVTLTASKYYAETPRVELTLTPFVKK